MATPKKIPNLSSILADQAATRVLRMQRYAAGQQKLVIRLLEDLEGKLALELEAANIPGVAAASYQRTRLTNLLKSTRETIRNAYREVNSESKKSAFGLVKVEHDFMIQAAEDAIGVNITGVTLSSQQLRSIASDTLIQGAPSKEWWGKQASDLQQRFTNTVRDGMLRGETNQQLVQRVRGTKALEYKDGVMNTSYRNAESLVRTSVMAVSNEARTTIYEENTDIIKGVQWLCFVAGTLVKTPASWKAIETIQAGDMVIGGSGQPRKVVATHRSRKRQMARVKLSNGQTLTCTSDHLFLTARGWKAAQFLSVGESLESQLKGEPAFVASAKPSL